MANQNQVAAKTSNQKVAPRHHYFRTIIASLFGFIALNLVTASILLAWLNNTITNTDKYVAMVSPLISSPDIQNFVSDQLINSIIGNSNNGGNNNQNNGPQPQQQQSLENSPLLDISKQLLGEQAVQGKTYDQLKTTVEPLLKQSINQILSSPQTAKLWTDTNRSAHAKFIAALKQPSGPVELDLKPVLDGVISQLSGTKLSFIQNKIDIAPGKAKVSFEGDKLDKARKAFHLFQTATLAVIVTAIISAILAILISVHHLKTLRRITFSTGISTGLLYLALSSSSFIAQKIGQGDIQKQKLASTIFNAITHDLRQTLLIISISCLVIAIGSKIWSVILSHKSISKK